MATVNSGNSHPTPLHTLTPAAAALPLCLPVALPPCCPAALPASLPLTTQIWSNNKDLASSASCLSDRTCIVLKDMQGGEEQRLLRVGMEGLA
ncbi:hypothetical protein E2C01_023450 [Portunus trituberculatus]|uniref:Uncharacterized protein n=1 Tax=Portunus trituberculatus TaxID=210409 RepID=A0A5B7E9U9_PORTR|nr:hypothetical protein [Portunus trituberculatus]